jgi:hypothetical protein
MCNHLGLGRSRTAIQKIKSVNALDFSRRKNAKGPESGIVENPGFPQ